MTAFCYFKRQTTPCPAAPLARPGLTHAVRSESPSTEGALSAVACSPSARPNAVAPFAMAWPKAASKDGVSACFTHRT
eukprot:m.190815 g.190815  ORF g.190815 m.190815 type:complete len:78 (+) comp18239_c0_seq6:1863-2096(+)